MSSDVYIRFYSQQDIGFENSIDQLRLGDIGVLAYFGYNVLNELITISDDKMPCISWALLMKDILLKLIVSIENDRNLDNKDFIMRYGYLGPNNIDWEDRFDEGLIDCAINEYSDKIMRIEWD